MIGPMLMLGALAASADARWRPIDDAAFHLRECTVRVGAEQSLLAVELSNPRDQEAAQAEACMPERRALEDAQRRFAVANRRMIHRFMPFFDAADPACWDALAVIDNDHGGVPAAERRNPQLARCRPRDRPNRR